MPKDLFLLTEFQLRSIHLSIGPTSFPIISLAKLAGKRVLLEFLTLVESYWRL